MLQGRLIFRFSLAPKCMKNYVVLQLVINKGKHLKLFWIKIIINIILSHGLLLSYFKQVIASGCFLYFILIKLLLQCYKFTKKNNFLSIFFIYCHWLLSLTCQNSFLDSCKDIWVPSSRRSIFCESDVQTVLRGQWTLQFCQWHKIRLQKAHIRW